MPEATTTSNQYRFLGWNRNAEATTAEYKAGQIAQISEYTIMYTITSTTSPLVATYYYMDEEGNGNPLQHSCLENPMDGGA